MDALDPAEAALNSQEGGSGSASSSKSHSTVRSPGSKGALSPTLEALRQVLRGKEEALSAALTCAIAGGHLLLEDQPGTGKTTLARALAASLGLSLRRVQMTSDLLPQDLTGASYPDLSTAPGQPGTAKPRFVPGPVFTEFLLADELNRTPPRTQSALLEAMAERFVTVDGERHELPSPFLVVATQNPIEFAGTFPLPESQLDRFMMRISPGYPDREAERIMLVDRRARDPLADLERTMGSPATAARLRAGFDEARRAVEEVSVADPVVDYLLDVVEATRPTSSESPFALGASPRAAIDLDRACRARAVLQGRLFVMPEDVAILAAPVLVHRLIAHSHSALTSESPGRLVADIVESIPPPRLNSTGELIR